MRVRDNTKETRKLRLRLRLRLSMTLIKSKVTVSNGHFISISKHS